MPRTGRSEVRVQYGRAPQVRSVDEQRSKSKVLVLSKNASDKVRQKKKKGNF